MALLNQTKTRRDLGTPLVTAVEQVVTQWQSRSKYLPGFGHRFHSKDPRRDPLLALVDEASKEGVVLGEFAEIGRSIELHINKHKSKAIPMNVDGATAIIYAELGFAPELARGLFCLSRGVGILSHAYEESTSGNRLKGPMPPNVLPKYVGPK